MGVSPGDPWVNLVSRTVNDGARKGYRDGDNKVDGSQSDETPVAAVSHFRVGSDETPELLSPPDEGADGEGWRQRVQSNALDGGKVDGDSHP